MQRAQLTAIASTIRAIRNDWDLAGIISQLQKLNYTWAGTDGELAAHAVTIAAKVTTAHTPGALNALTCGVYRSICEHCHIA